MKIRIAITIVATIATLAACKREAAAPVVNPNGNYQHEVWVLPAAAGSSAPDLSLAPDGRLLLSWINRTEGRRNALQFGSYSVKGGWQSQPRTVAVGNSLVANWADTPHMRGTADGALWMQWLQNDASGPAAYDTVLARSRDGGVTWNQITRVNNDGKAVEHGFAAMWAEGADGIGIAWLDGREKAPGQDETQHAGGAMQVRQLDFDLDLQRGTETVLDAMACDCCQTDAAVTSKGPLVVYRDRSDDDIRDIAVVRRTAGTWSAPVMVHADGWKIAGCPVNGPAIAASGNDAVVGWYSEAGDKPALRLARTTDAGDTFAAPVLVDSGKQVLGRVDVAIGEKQAWVTWLREANGVQTLMLARYTSDLSRELQRMEIATLKGRGHATGSPRLAVDSTAAWLVWTDVIGGVAHLQGARVAR
ncbi:MAG: sialidase family protein [Thermomonas sp.]